jgi:phenylacetate-CoA ligase
MEELRDIQSELLRKLIAHAYAHSPHYRRTLEERALRPSDIRTIDDLGRLPLLTREAARDGSDVRMSKAEPLPRIRKMTSGTTGLPLEFAYDLGSEYWRQATKLRGYGWAGYHPGDRSIHFWGSTSAIKKPPWKKKAKASLDHFVRREHYIDCSDHSEEALSSVVRQLREIRPKVILCYARAGAALARHIIEKKSRDWENLSVIAAAERLFPADRAAMTLAFGPDIFETYGSREVMLIAAECDAHQGLHVSMENLAVEILVRDGVKERAAQPGELGEVVVTDLHNYGAPFIRYVNGDLAVASPVARCACGRDLGRLQRVEGRETDTLRDGQGKPVGGPFFLVVFSMLADKVRAFQVVQRKDRSIDVSLVPGRLYSDSLLDEVKHNCEKVIPGVEFRMHAVADIPVLPSGKSRVVVVET